MAVKWHNTTKMHPQDYRCGHHGCGKEVASDVGYPPDSRLDGRDVSIYICPRCSQPTYFGPHKQIPDVAPGGDVQHVPDDVHRLYDEARSCVSVGAYTASVLACRKLLMNIAVSQKAEPGKTFVAYVEYLASHGYVPPNGGGWVDHIRKKGNEATHEIPDMNRDDAIELIAFAEMLLKFIYEFPARVPAAKVGE